MANSFERGLSGSQVSQWAQNDTNTPAINTSFITPYGLKLQQTITSSGSVTIPANITFVYAIVVGAGSGGGYFGNSGGAGGVAWGWTLASSSCIVGAGSNGGATNQTSGGFTRYGNIITGGGICGNFDASLGGAGGSNGSQGRAGGTNYWGMPGGGFINSGSSLQSYNGNPGSGGSGGSYAGKGGDGISGGGGGIASGNGGSGLVGGGGGSGGAGGNGGLGGNGFNIATNVITTGGLNSGGAGGGGGGTAGNGFNAVGNTGGNGGLGGGGGGAAVFANTPGTGGNGIIYLYY
jgi:hypothetical protein